MLALLLVCFMHNVSSAQIHYEDIAKIRATYVDVQTYSFLHVVTNGIGNFAVGHSGEGMRLLTDYFEPLSVTEPIYSQTNYGDVDPALATNHNSDLALITCFQSAPHHTNLAIRILSNEPDNGRINMNKLRVLETALPGYSGSYEFPDYNHGSGVIPTKVWDLEAAMNEKYVFITWKEEGVASGNCPPGTGATNYGYAVYDYINKVFVIAPSQLRDPNGDIAFGKSTATVAVNKWSNGTDACIAFSYMDQREQGYTLHEHAARSNYPFAAANTTVLQEPVNPTNTQACKWVRVVDYDEPDKLADFHFFYAYYYPIANQPTINLCLFSTDDIAVSGIINDKLPPAQVENIAPNAVGNGYTAKAVYLAYKTEQAKRQNANQQKPLAILNICRQWGEGDFNHVWSPWSFLWGSADDIFCYSVGCNQLGIHVIYVTDDHGPNGGNMPQMPYDWHAARPIAQHVRENTLLTGDENTIETNQWHKEANEGDIMVTPALPDVPGIRPCKGDTLRVHEFTQPIPDPDAFYWMVVPTEVKFSSSGAPVAINAGVHSSYVNFDGAVNRQAPGRRRGYIILDPNTTVDFNNIQNSEIGAVYNGGLEYNGAALNNMNQTFLMVQGSHNHPDTTYAYRGVAYFNAPCTINNGSSFISNKGQIRFKTASTQADMALFKTEGQQTGIIFDTTIAYLGARNTGQNLTQIEVAGKPFTDNGQYIKITNSIISSGWENLAFWFTTPAGYCSQISVNATSQAWFFHNHFYTTYVEIVNPLGTVWFNYNKIHDIRDMLRVVWFPPAGDPGYPEHFQYGIQINHNVVYANYPRGNGSWQDWAHDFWVTGFDYLTAYGTHPVEISLNQITGNDETTTLPFQSKWTAIQIDLGTNADVTSNSIRNVGIGVYHHGAGTSTSLICNNEIGQNLTGCVVGHGIGIEQNRGLGVTKLNNIFKEGNGYIGEVYDQSYLVRNNIHDNAIGATFITGSQTILNGIHTTYTNIPGMNEFDNNVEVIPGSYWAGSLCQIELPMTINGAHPAPKIGADVAASDEPLWGQNKFRSTGDRSDGGLRQHIWYHCTDCGPGAIFYDGGFETLSLNEWTPNTLTGNNRISCSTCPQDIMVPFYAHFNKKLVVAQLGNIVCDYDNGIAGGKGSGPLSIVDWPEPQGNPEDDDSLYLWKRANLYRGVDGRKGLDTMRLYVERHPYATHPPGEVVDGIVASVGFTGQLPNLSKKDWIENYDWLAKIQPVNPERQYQFAVINSLATTLEHFDLNESANMWYNYQLIFNDSESIAVAGDEIRRIRDYQKFGHQDSTPFYALTFPLKPKGTNVVAAGPTPAAAEMTIVSDPNSKEINVSYDLSYDGEADFSIYDQLGKELLHRRTAYLQKGEQKITLQLNGLPSGTYYLRMLTGKAVTTKPFIVVR